MWHKHLSPKCSLAQAALVDIVVIMPKPMYSTERYDSLPEPLKDLVDPLLPGMWFYEPDTRDLKMLEVMSGTGKITDNVNEKVGPAMGYDKAYTEDMDILTHQGFALLLKLALRVQSGGTTWFGILCSSWIWLSRSVSKRSRSNPAGDCSRPFVAEANEMVRRCVAIATILYLRFVNLCFEHPPTTVMFFFDQMRTLVDHVCPYCFKTFLGDFGSECLKELMLRASNVAFQELERFKPRMKSKPMVTKGKWITGKREDLKESQSYPDKFGYAVAMCVKTMLEFKEQHSVRQIFGAQAMMAKSSTTGQSYASKIPWSLVPRVEQRTPHVPDQDDHAFMSALEDAFCNPSLASSIDGSSGSSTSSPTSRPSMASWFASNLSSPGSSSLSSPTRRKTAFVVDLEDSPSSGGP